ncbi:hypothetical protein H0H92_015015 [Tricholoma furcatifolium]|nr:hypothetical protein H0H92_015015 [Tricholoma furcatifolium]
MLRESSIRRKTMLFFITGLLLQKALQLVHLRVENTTVSSAIHVVGPINVSTPGSCQSEALVSSSLCRVQFFINTTSTSVVHAEAWLPDTWFGRFLGLGNGGIDYTNLDYGSSLHFAAIGSDNGHDGSDGSFFLDHPEVINDFAFRAVHVEAVIGKQIVEAYYGRPQDKSYYLGCSTGGRQGTQAALKFPDDFDGIVAGSPATNWNNLQGWSAILGRYVGAPDPTGNPSFIPATLWDTIAAEVLKQCDGLDGVLDGIITEPDACEFRPEAILCTSISNATNCLTSPQVDALHKIYQPLFGLDGQLLYSRYDPGAEGDGDAGALLSVATFRLSNLAEESFSPIMDEDQLIASGNSKQMYNLISETLSMPSLDPFYRLFLIPGMDHCAGGPGATLFGQGGIASNAVNDSSHNVLLAMVDWVENGNAPEVIIGTDETGQSRMHCMYPQRSVWNGTVFVCEP